MERRSPWERDCGAGAGIVAEESLWEWRLCGGVDVGVGIVVENQRLRRK